MSLKEEGQSMFSTRRRKWSLPGAFVVVMILSALGLGGYLFLERLSPARTRAIQAAEDQRIAPAEQDQHPAPDADRIEVFVAENGLEESFWILIGKGCFELSTWNGTEREAVFPIAVGENPGNKERVGDRRTPEGVFRVERTHDSRTWVHDFGDGKGPVEGAYGPFFIRLETGWKGIGIHGTHDPSSLGKMVTEGCIRMSNEAVMEIVERSVPGTVVIIEP